MKIEKRKGNVIKHKMIQMLQCHREHIFMDGRCLPSQYIEFFAFTPYLETVTPRSWGSVRSGIVLHL